MVETTEIEKKSLEAHVELCAERYNALETRIEGLDANINKVADMVAEVKSCVHKMSEKRTDQLIGWGVGIIGFLVATVGWLVSHYVIK
jgi:prefoldin subunit 5